MDRFVCKAATAIRNTCAHPFLKQHLQHIFMLLAELMYQAGQRISILFRIFQARA